MREEVERLVVLRCSASTMALPGGTMRKGTFALLMAAVIGLTACTDDGDEGLDLGTPTATSSTTPAATTSSTTPAATTSTASDTPSVTTEEQAVLDAYRGFYKALDEAQADPQRSQDYLNPVATGTQFETTNGGIKAEFLDGKEAYGTPVLKPEVHSVDGDQAVVRDCQDTSAVGTRNAETGEELTVGRNPSSVETLLQRVDGVWKVAQSNYVAQPEAYCS